MTAQLSPVDAAKQLQGQPEVSAVSLCVSQNERHPSLVLRIGGPGRTETVIRSGPKQRFYTFTAEDHTHYGRDVIWVRTGSTEYCVGTAIGQGRGVSLDIFIDSQWRYRLFSGRSAGVTYEVAASTGLQQQVQALLRKGRDSSCV